MSVKHNKKKNNNAGGGNAAMKKDIQDLKAAGESTAALLAMSFKAQIVQDRAAGTDAISDEMILQSAEVIDYPEWEDAHSYNTVGEILKYNGRYYEVIAAHTSNGVAYPVETTFAYYRLIELTHTGTIDDPIPLSGNGGNCRERRKREVLQLQGENLPCKSRYAELRISARYTFLVAMGKGNKGKKEG